MEIKLNKEQCKDILDLVPEGEEWVGIQDLKDVAEKAGKNSFQRKLHTSDWDTGLIRILVAYLRKIDHRSKSSFGALLRTRERDEKGEAAVTSLSDFPDMFTSWFNANKGSRGWLFKHSEGQRPLAFLVTDCIFIPYERRAYQARKNDGRLALQLAYNAKGEFHTSEITLSHSEVLGFTVEKALARLDLFTEDDEFLEQYDGYLDRYNKYLPAQGEQFECKGRASLHETAKRRNSWWGWDDQKVDLAPDGNPTRCVIDGEVLDIAEYDDDDDRSYRRRGTALRRKYPSKYTGPESPVPTHPLIYVYHLGYHKYAWVHARDLKRYQYDADLADKLVMPKAHTKLVDALTNGIFIPKRDAEGKKRSKVIQSKGKSTIILAVGPPGLGKTLTAEAYSEKIERPLLEIQAGELGTTVSEVENKLRGLCDMAKRLKMPIVINEAEAYVKARGDDRDSNAITTVFLRVLEYHNGLVFLTSNRPHDIDDAIKSRALVILVYKTPRTKERTRLWEVLSSEFDVDLSGDLIERLVEKFPKVSGRDIMQLLNLVKRYAQELKKEVDLELFEECYPFRGIQTDEDISREKKEGG